METKSRKKIIVGIPCFNEGRNLPLLLNRFVTLSSAQNKYQVEVVVVDDGSTDDTAEQARHFQDKLELRIVSHGANRGLHGSLFTIFSNFIELSNEHVIACVTMDGDDSHDPVFISMLVEKLVLGKDVVIASRYRYNSKTHGVPFHRRVTSASMAALFCFARPIPGVRDYSCGYRAYAPKVIHKLFDHYKEKLVETKSFACMVELLVKCHQIGCSFDEVPFELHYERKRGDSKMQFFRTIRETLQVLRRYY